MTTLEIEAAPAVLAAQPFSQLLGARVVDFGTGRATLELDLDGRLRQQFGFAHGGVLAYLADNALTFAAGSVLGADVVTSGMALDYLRPAQNGPLVASSTVEATTSRGAVCRVTVSSPDGICVVGQGRAQRTRTEAPPDLRG